MSDDGVVSEKSIKDEIGQAVERAGDNPNTTMADVFDFSFLNKAREGIQ
ncbi:MAG: hypothetical protein Q8O86_13315 [Dehalococcoidia bacterium]|nr:hypothetical protein [Dehalococcoidia bacterium]